MSIKNPSTSMERVLQKRDEEFGEPLEKRSKNVREQTRNITPQQAHERVMQYVRRAGFRAQPARSDKFGVGSDQRGLNYNDGIGSPAHELGHAYMTPVGESLREHQKKMGNLTTPQSARAMPERDHRLEEGAAFGMEPQIKRRAGVSPKVSDNAYKYHAQNDKPDSTFGSYAEGRARGVAQLNAVDEGRKVIGPKGQVVTGTSVDAKINARAARQKMPQTSMDRALARRKG